MKHLETRDITLAATLLCHAIELESIEKQGRIGTFIFNESRELTTLLGEYAMQRVCVEPKAFHENIRKLTRLVTNLEG